MTAEASEAAVRAELWISFESLLRAYAAALALDGGLPQVLGRDDGSLVLRGAVASVLLRLDVASGAGAWSLEKSVGEVDRGTFVLEIDGTMQWSPQPEAQPMDVIAEMLVTLVVEP